MDALNRADPEITDRALHEKADRFLSAFETDRTPMQRILAELDEIQVRAVSGNGLVEVTVDADGTVTWTDVAPEAVRSGPRELASAFTEAARAAGESAREQRAALLALLAEFADITGPATELVGTVHICASPYLADHATAAELH